MPKDNVVHLIQPCAFDDQLTEVLRDGARALLTQAVEAEVAAFLAKPVTQIASVEKPILSKLGISFGARGKTTFSVNQCGPRTGRNRKIALCRF